MKRLILVLFLLVSYNVNSQVLTINNKEYTYDTLNINEKERSLKYSLALYDLHKAENLNVLSNELFISGICFNLTGILLSNSILNENESLNENEFLIIGATAVFSATIIKLISGRRKSDATKRMHLYGSKLVINLNK